MLNITAAEARIALRYLQQRKLSAAHITGMTKRRGKPAPPFFYHTNQLTEP